MKARDQAELVARLARSFPVLRIGEEREDVASLLGGIDYGEESDEVGFLAQVGLLKVDGDDVSNAALLRFLERHGQTWFAARLEAFKAQLREQLGTGGDDSTSTPTKPQRGSPEGAGLEVAH